MDRYAVALATRADEPEIRALVASVAMPGSVAIRFEREPDYLLGTSVMGDPCDVVVVREAASGRLAGVGCRGERRVFVDGREARVGYLGGIRVAPGHRGRWLLAYASRWLAGEGRTSIPYFGVVARDNPRARDLLVGRRAPRAPDPLRVVRLAGLTSCSILLRPSRVRRPPGVAVGPATASELPEVIAFLRREGARRQLYPAYRERDLVDGTLRDLAVGDIAVARRRGEIVGTLAAWDQSGFKQDVVDGYGPTLRRLRPAYDLAARLLGAQPLTRPGEAVPLALGACLAVAGDDPDLFDALLDAAGESARHRGKAYLMLGLADEDPLLARLRRRLSVRYRSDLYSLAWPPAEPIAAGRVPYIEIAAL